MNILSRSESQFAPSAEKLKRTHSSGSVNNSSTYSHTNQSGKNSVGNNEVGSKRSSTRSAGKKIQYFLLIIVAYMNCWYDVSQVPALRGIGLMVNHFLI